MRLIDADALIEKCGGWYVEEGTESGFIGTLKNLLATESTIQPVATDTNVEDIISRQAAIDAIKLYMVTDGFYDMDENVQGFNDGISCAIRELSDLPSAKPEPTTEIQEILNYLDTTLHPIVSPDNWNVYAELHDMVSKLPSAQPEEAIPISWIEAIIKKFMMAGDAFSSLTASIIRAMLNEWKKEQEGGTT